MGVMAGSSGMVLNVAKEVPGNLLGLTTFVSGEASMLSRT